MNNIQKNMSAARLNRTSHFRAFTLIEMLIAVTLVLLMMVLFAEIFSLAANSMNLQRGISENDQQVRTLTTVLRNDLQKRTFRNCVPFFPDESIDDENSSYSFGNRAGYFYISINDPANGRDNVLQFTIRSTERDGDPNETPYFGAAAALPGNFLQNPNQPEHDDGDISPNGAMSSSAAEVCYFLRGDKLYRRQLLLREPLPSSGATNPQPIRQSDGAQYFGNAPVIYTGEFLRDFDLSAIGSPTGAILLGVESLNNESATTLPLGQSVNRFGFNQVDGLSREFGDSTGTFYLGRFTHEETSADNFKFPQLLTEQQGGGTLGNGIPYDAVNTPVTDARDIYGNAVADGIVDEFEEDIPGAIPAGTRRGEDLLLTNVHEFTVKVWDDRLQSFVPLAHSQASAGIDGHFNVNRQLNSGYAPVGGSAAIFDTWHQSYDRNGDSEDTNGNATLDPGEDTNSNGILDLNHDWPPFLPMRWDPADIPITGPPPTNTPGDSHWLPDESYAVGDIVFPRTEDLNYNNILDASEDIGIPPGDSSTTGNGGKPDHNAAGNYLGRGFAYRCIEAGRSGDLVSEPAWRKTNTAEVYGTQNPGFPGEPPPTWETVENLVPLKAIQVTVRFLHVQTNKMRQITLIHSMTAN
jgi:type II secretory pathway pseudopilin PulG